jgi:hypothetical protein
MPNADLREIIRKSRIRYWEIARKLDMAPSNFSCMLQKELSPEKKSEILEVVEILKGE